MDYSKDYPLILTSGRLVEYEGGGDETRPNAWIASKFFSRQFKLDFFRLSLIAS